MSNPQNTLSTAFGMIITFFVPTVVWGTLMAGLYQLVRDSIRRARAVLRSSRKLTESAS